MMTCTLNDAVLLIGSYCLVALVVKVAIMLKS